MSIVCEKSAVLEQYQLAGERGWVLPCFCSENLTTTEAVLTAAEEYRIAHQFDRLPIILAITCQYGHRGQAANYTKTRRWDVGLRLFTESMKVLAGDDGPFAKLNVMLHLDHIQYDTDLPLLEGDFAGYASIMYDASNLPMEENIKRTARFVEQRGKEILIEGACDEIAEAGGTVRNALTTAEAAVHYREKTGVDLLVCNLGTEHRASGKELQYHGDSAREIKEKIGARIVLHGASSVPDSQLSSLYQDGICKVNLWTALERDASPALFADMVRHAGQLADSETLCTLEKEGLLTPKAAKPQGMSIRYFTTLYRQTLVFGQMKKAIRNYLDLWYRGK